MQEKIAIAKAFLESRGFVIEVSNSYPHCFDYRLANETAWMICDCSQLPKMADNVYDEMCGIKEP